MFPGRSRPFFTAGALQSRGPYGARRSLRSRFCEAALRKSYALHRARETDHPYRVSRRSPGRRWRHVLHYIRKETAALIARQQPFHRALPSRQLPLPPRRAAASPRLAMEERPLAGPAVPAEMTEWRQANRELIYFYLVGLFCSIAIYRWQRAFF
jgi:hypothetical protein